MAGQPGHIGPAGRPYMASQPAGHIGPYMAGLAQEEDLLLMQEEDDLLVQEEP